MMKRLRIIASTLTVISILALNPIGASASTGGWHGDNASGWWYVDDSGNYVTGWKYIDGNWYYLNSNGTMAHDTTVGGYYLGSNGAWTTDKYSSQHKTLGSTSSDTSFQQNLQQSSHADYFNNADRGVSSGAGDGSIARSNRENGIGDTTTTSTSTSQKSTSGGWEQVNGAWYYYDANGQKKTGWIQDGGNWYFLNNEGSMATGWVQSGGSWYYLQGDGSMATSKYIGSYWVNASGVWSTPTNTDNTLGRSSTGGSGGISASGADNKSADDALHRGSNNNTLGRRTTGGDQYTVTGGAQDQAGDAALHRGSN